mgnify:CR=1 FL=1
MSAHKLRTLDKLLVANRGEIAIRIFRAATELGLRTVAIYTNEDRYSLHRYKADEGYQIGCDSEPLRPYLDIDQIVSLALDVGVDAIHPGYGFLSENVEFADKCAKAGIIFVGPGPDAMRTLGDKVRAKKIALKAGVPTIPASEKTLSTPELARAEAERIGFPIMLKAAAGGGGRGMRVVRNAAEIDTAYSEARNEAKRAFGDDTIFIEKFLERPKHIEIQLLGDEYGNLVHLLERDCSVQRRFQKVVEIAPCPSLADETRNLLFDYALKIGRAVNYSNAGTVEFLVDANGEPYFIEVNPRIQVEHTVTEEITGIDIVRSQILIAKGHALSDPQIYIRDQSEVRANGYAIQCRITTENPENDFTPDYGKIIAYRSPGGFGVRLDAGNAYSGVTISPFFDSLLVKVTGWGRTLKGASQRLARSLAEFRVRGVHTNIPFLHNVISHRVFQKGQVTVAFLNEHPELFELQRGRDRATKVLNYLADVIVNGNPDVKRVDHEHRFRTAFVPECDQFSTPTQGSKQRLDALGPDDFCKWLRDCKEIQYTDTTLRDAHQSLLATRVRTVDMLAVTESFAHHHPEVFSLEMWGGATFDVAMRFLSECPWERLRLIRERAPNILLQMLLRGSNAVGYSAYPDNLVIAFIEQAAEDGIDVFRIFDSMNWLEAMRVSITTVRERTNSLAEVSMCYTGDISDPQRSKYSLQYYLDLAVQLEDAGAHIIAVKDMAGLLKPHAAEVLISRLRDKVKVPIHLHTHDTSGVQAATYLKAVEAGVDVLDVALASMSGLTSQPNFNSVVEMLRGHDRELPIDRDSLNTFSSYWEDIREYYYPFESELRAGTGEVFVHEIPGGQYSNLRPQARGLGLEDQFETIKHNYTAVNALLGDIVKVTPSSKVVGDLAMFMTSNNLSTEDLLSRGAELSFPDSLVSFFRGDLGQPHGGFPEQLQRIVLKGEPPFTERPNEHLSPVDFEAELSTFRAEFGSDMTLADFISYKLYPRVFTDYHSRRSRIGNVMPIPTPAFFYGLQPNEEISVEIDRGKTLLVKYLYATAADEDGMRTVFFELNGQTRGVEVKDSSVESKTTSHLKVSSDSHVGAPLQGKLYQILVDPGQAVAQGDALFVIEAMKMETTVTAPKAGTVAKVHLAAGEMVEQDDLVLEMGAVG